jgi:hypothetical protein
VGNTTSTSYARSGLSAGTIYYWKIVAKNTCGNSTSGPVWSFTTSTTTDSTWLVTLSSKLKIKGWVKDSSLLYGTCHIYPNGTFLLSEDDHGITRSYTGTYSIYPGGKTILFTLDSNGLLQIKAMLTKWVQDLAEGVVVENISFSFDQVSISKGKISKKTNAPSKVTIKITGTMSASSGGIYKTASFSYQSKINYYSP